MNIIQIGANRGNDDVSKIIDNQQPSLLILVEPMKLHNEALNTFYDWVDNKFIENIVIDTVGRDIELIQKQREKLHVNGYKTIMFMLYVPLDVCIKRVKGRDRVYDESITIDSWYLSYGNIVNFKREFLDDFHLIYNDEITNTREKILILLEGLMRNSNNKYL
jgi:hypothetical protein